MYFRSFCKEVHKEKSKYVNSATLRERQRLKRPKSVLSHRLNVTTLFYPIKLQNVISTIKTL